MTRISFWRRPAGRSVWVTGTAPEPSTGTVSGSVVAKQIGAEGGERRQQRGGDVVGVDLVAGEQEQVRPGLGGGGVGGQGIRHQVVEVGQDRRAQAVQLETGAVEQPELGHVGWCGDEAGQPALGVAEAALVVVGRVAEVEQLEASEVPLPGPRRRPDRVALHVEGHVVTAHGVGRDAGDRGGHDGDVQGPADPDGIAAGGPGHGGRHRPGLGAGRSVEERRGPVHVKAHGAGLAGGDPDADRGRGHPPEHRAGQEQGGIERRSPARLAIPAHAAS